MIAMVAIGTLLAGPLWAFGEEKPVPLPNQERAPSERGGGFRLWGGAAGSEEMDFGKPMNLMDDGMFQRFEEPPPGLPPARERPAGSVREEKRRQPPGKRGEESRRLPVAEGKGLNPAPERIGQDSVRGTVRRGESGPGNPGAVKGDDSKLPAIERVEEGFLGGADPLFAPPPPVAEGGGRPGMEPPAVSGEVSPPGVLTLPSGPLTDSAPSGEGWNPGSEWYGQDGNPWR
ncbi:MAG: hypothetical protein HQM01_06195 [Magnetococcales bacterium]|nr:hypothetical protein [Magnetococcales bacterium]